MESRAFYFPINRKNLKNRNLDAMFNVQGIKVNRIEPPRPCGPPLTQFGIWDCGFGIGDQPPRPCGPPLLSKEGNLKRTIPLVDTAATLLCKEGSFGPPGDFIPILFQGE
jgi:hypothetical protein